MTVAIPTILIDCSNCGVKQHPREFSEFTGPNGRRYVRGQCKGCFAYKQACRRQARLVR